MVPQVTKNRFDGDLGNVSLSFDKESLTLSGYFKERKTGATRWRASPSKRVASSSLEGPMEMTHEPQREKSVVTKLDRHKGQPSSQQSALASSASPPTSILKAHEAIKLQPIRRTRAHAAFSPHPTGKSQPVKTGTKLSDLTRTRQQRSKTCSRQEKVLDPKELHDMMKFVEEVDLLG